MVSKKWGSARSYLYGRKKGEKFGALLDWLLVAASHETMRRLLLFSNAWEAKSGSTLSAFSTWFI